MNDLIFDVGMHNGDDAAYYLSLGYNVVAVEASPYLVKEAEARFEKYILDNRIEILNVAIAQQDGDLDFYLNKHTSVWNSLDKNLGSRGGAGYEIKTVRTKSLDRLIAERGLPYYLKIDIEGYDRVALLSLLNCSEKPKYISIELYDWDEILLLSQLGYTKFKIIDQLSFLPLEIPSTKELNAFKKEVAFKKSRNIFIRLSRKLFGKLVIKNLEKRYKYLFNYCHPNGSSGPFGKYLPGKWHTLDEIKKVFFTCQNEFETSTGNKNNGWWVDIHATY